MIGRYGSRGVAAQCAVPFVRVVVDAPSSDVDLFLLQGVKDLVLHPLASVTLKRGNTAIAITAAPARKLDHSCYQSFFVFSVRWNASLSWAILSEQATGRAFDSTRLVINPIDTLPTTRSAG